MSTAVKPENYNKVAICKFKGVAKEYAFALYDDNIVSGDTVVCDTVDGLKVLKVIEVIDASEYTKSITKEVVCKVDVSTYERRLDIRKRKQQLKTKMDKIVKEANSLIWYNMIAENDPEMKSLLEEYNKLS